MFWSPILFYAQWAGRVIVCDCSTTDGLLFPFVYRADISKQVGTRSAKDCEAHYMQYYIYAPIDHLKGIAPVPTCEGTCQVASIPYKGEYSDSLSHEMWTVNRKGAEKHVT